jgi:hypothetical protein
MRLTGKEKVSLYAEQNEKSNFIASELELKQLINGFILDKLCQQLIRNKDNGKIVTEYLSINDMKILKGTKVSLKFQVSLKKNEPFFKKVKYSTMYDKADISEFYNYVIELFEFYAYELDTVIDNIKIELKELKILNEKE